MTKMDRKCMEKAGINNKGCNQKQIGRKATSEKTLPKMRGLCH